jgi:predicted RNA-binding Zn ribbon-like protein
MSGDAVTTGATLLGEPLPVELMNTLGIDREGVMRDALESDAEVAAWLRAVGDRIATEAGVTLDRLDEDTVRPIAGRTRQLRDALRRLAAEATEDPRPPATPPEMTRPVAITTLNALAGVWPQLVWPADGRPGRAFRAVGTPVDLALGLIAHQGVELLAGDRRERLRACLAPNCLLFFVREGARREWCSAVCGNRARVARHYHRHQATRRD